MYPKAYRTLLVYLISQTPPPYTPIPWTLICIVIAAIYIVAKIFEVKKFCGFLVSDRVRP